MSQRALLSSRVPSDTERGILAYMTGPKRMDGYVRVSRRMGRAGPAYISPKIQKEAIERWAQYRDVEIIKWHEDEDHSGGTQNRPGIREAIRRIEAGDTEGIACWRLNRFARNVSAAIEDVKRIEAAGGYLAFVEEDIDPTGPFGSFLLTVLLAVSTLERDNISSGWQSAKTRAVERGVKVGRAPMGYEKNEDGVLVLSEEADLMREVFRLAGRGSLQPVLSLLKKNRPDRAWTMSTIRRLLASRTYLGEVSYGDLLNANAHEPLVTRSEWEAAQQPSEQRRKPDAFFPLSGIAVCAGCGFPMVGSRSNEVRVYRCKYQYSRPYGTRHDCEAPAVISAERLESYTRKVLKRVWMTDGWRVSDTPPEGADEAQAALEDAEAELFAFAEDRTMRKALGDAKYHELLGERTDAVEEAQKAFREQAKESARETRVLPSELLETTDPEELRELLTAAFSKIEVTKGRGKVSDRVKLLLYGSDVPVSAPEDA